MSTEKHQSSVTARFSAASKTYHAKAEVQKIVAERLLSLASDIRPIKRILEIGCGTGVLTELFLEHFPGITIDAMDASKEMVDRAKERLYGNDRVRWYISDLKTFAPNVLYPLIISSSSMHWILPVEDGFRRMADLLEVGGDVVVALMLHGTLAELHAMRLGVAPHKPPLGRLPLAEEVLSGMKSVGLQVLAKQQETIRMDYVSANAFLRTIHEQGLTGGDVSSSERPLTRGELQRLRKAYEARYTDGGAGVFASYKVLYLRATKPTLHQG